MMRVLFLDDNDKRISLARKTFESDDLFVAETAQRAILALMTPYVEWDLVMLDHDLGGEENGYQAGGEPTGMDVVDYIINTKAPIKRIVIHSWNQPAAERMLSKLVFSGYNAVRKPFAIMQ